MRVSAKVDYALRALSELAAAPPGPVKAERLATAQEIPLKFLENILLELRRAEIVASQRGADGGYRLAKPPAEVSLADVIRAVEGPIATVRGVRPEETAYTGAATGLRDVWIELRTSMRGVLEETSLADLVRARRSGEARACDVVEDPLDSGAQGGRRRSARRAQLQLLALVARQLRPRSSPRPRAMSSTRTSKPRCTTRSIIASVPPSTGSRRISRS